MSMTEPELDSTASVTLVVATSDLASTLSADPLDDFPPVFATSRMIALMELAAAKLLRACQGPGELSVGVTVDITHSAATPAGVEVKATARYTGREGKLFVFEVVAHDPGGEIGRGVHKRAIISRERLMFGATRRNPSA
jgi:fluoroacetyl-CoA thioesterase